MSRGGDTEVRVYEGEVEHFVGAARASASESSSTAAPASPTPARSMSRRSPRCSPRRATTSQFGTVDEWAGLAVPDGVASTDQSLWNDELAAFPTEGKIDLAKGTRAAAREADHRVRVDDSNYADAFGEAAVATTTGIRLWGRETGCSCGCRPWPTRATRPRPVSASPSAGPRTTTSRGGAGSSRPGNAPVGRDEAADAPNDLVLDPFVTAQLLGIISSTLNGEAVVKGRWLFRDRLGEEVASALVTISTTRPTRSPTRRPTSTVKALRHDATCSSRAGCSRFRAQLVLGAAGGDGGRATPCAVGSPVPPGWARWRCSSSRARARKRS